MDGVTYQRNHYDDVLLMQEAVALGKIHRCLDGKIALPEGFPAPWFDKWSRERTIEKYKMILAHKVSRGVPEENHELIEACQTRLTLLQGFETNYKSFKALMVVNSHGDYHNLQMLVDEKKRLSAVIDFSSAASVPAVWELLRSYTLSAEECIHGDRLDVDRLKRYVDAYLTVRPLPLFDITHMAEFYYFSLLRSAYGFDGVDRKTAEFAVWRTKMCAYLCAHAGEIGAYLREKYVGVLV